MIWTKMIICLVGTNLVVQANAEKCKDYFATTGGNSVCAKQGYVKAKSNDHECKESCDITQCCKGQATCNAFFIDNGKSMCTDHGYENRRNHETTCSDGICYIDDCCKNQNYVTCYSYFETNGKSICETEGYLKREKDTTKCSGKECDVTECCKGQNTCNAYFSDNGKDICTKKGYENRRNSDTNCKGDPCKVDECCKNKTPTETTCKDYFGKDDPATKCATQGYKKAQSNDIVCEGDSCAAEECCKGRPEIKKVETQCKDTSSCIITIKGSGFGQKCEVPVHAADWDPPTPLETITKNLVCTPDLVHAQISKSVADKNKQVNLQVTNKNEGTWTAAELVTLY